MSTTHPIQDGRQYRRLILGVIAVGIASLLVGMAIDRSLLGLVVYAVAVFVAVGTTFVVRFRGSLALKDERERELERRASDFTFKLFGYLGLFAFVALLLLDAAGEHALSQSTSVLLQAYGVVALTWGGIYVVLRYRA